MLIPRTRRLAAILGLSLGAMVLFGAESRAGEVFYSVSLQELEVTEGQPNLGMSPWSLGWAVRQNAALLPAVLLDGEGEACVCADPSDPTQRLVLAARVEHEGDVTGRILLPDDRLESMTAGRFRIAADRGSAAGETFHAARRSHYQRLSEAGIPGAAWFRLQALAPELQKDGAAGQALPEAAGQNAPNRAESELEETFGLFTGARALSENLQLDRVLRAGEASAGTVDVESLGGITVRGYDWSARVKDLQPELDPLARAIPADQHALFFPSFDALAALADEAARTGTPLLRLLEGQAADAFTRERYEHQLCLPLSELTRKLGPMLVASVAVTGSDPYLRTGSDVAMLFESKAPEALLAFLAAAHQAAAAADESVEMLSGQSGGMRWAGARSPDRSICSYAARDGDVVLVTNSLVQVEALASVLTGERAALASLPEYAFFRARYHRSAEPETALLVLSDATIRRWCGPRWRVGASRRIRAAAAFAHDRARQVAALSRNETPPPGDAPLAATYGTLAFQTPIAELSIERVTQAEADAYRRFRDSYQREWQQFFDPIAVRVALSGQDFESDVSVLPLIAASDLREFMEVTHGVSIRPGDGDPHAEAILHFVLALNFDSPPLSEASDFLEGMMLGLRVKPFGWVGDSVAVYIDDDPVWDEFQQLDELEERFEHDFSCFPVALTAEVKDPLGLAAFLTALRGFVEQSAPGTLEWQTIERGDRSYVKVTARGDAFGRGAEGAPGKEEDYSVCYAVLPGRFVVSPNEKLVQRALDRAAAASPPQDTPWPGESVAVRLNRRALDALQLLWGDWQAESVRDASWCNLPILNEWKRLFPAEDPVVVHERHFHQRLVCPGGGQYSWNEALRTMESTAFGCPEAPRGEAHATPLLDAIESAEAGLTFEEDGVRAVFRMRRS
ncbi:MAG: hypothetical protein HY812_00300 [Planctomycetes bacterium]|nr:hypothetical protein [Planctomycetota bacterium]